MDKACHFCLSFLRFLLFRNTCFHCHLTRLATLASCKPESYLEHSRFMFKWQCLNKRKKNCAAFFLPLPENIMGVHILNILQMSGSHIPAGILYWMCGYSALWYLIKTLIWVEGCWFKTSLRSIKINCCMFVLLVAVEASYFLWTSLDVLALEVQL